MKKMIYNKEQQDKEIKELMSLERNRKDTKINYFLSAQAQYNGFYDINN